MNQPWLSQKGVNGKKAQPGKGTCANGIESGCRCSGSWPQLDLKRDHLEIPVMRVVDQTQTRFHRGPKFNYRCGWLSRHSREFCIGTNEKNRMEL
jgi:hypothetical protein